MDITNALYGKPPPEAVTLFQTTEALPEFWCVSVDLGSVNDATAICVTEVSKGFVVELSKARFDPVAHEVKRTPELSYTVKLLHRPRLNVSYVDVVNQVLAIAEDLPPIGSKPPLVVWDATGLGKPVVDMARQRGIRSLAITITSGNNASLVGSDWSVPKALLLGTLRTVMHKKLLKVAEGFRDRHVLESELSSFQAKVSSSGRATLEADPTADFNDDTVLSLALGIFASANRPQPAEWRRVNIFRR